MGITVTLPPSEYPVSLAEAIEHCRAVSGQDDDYISALIGAATDYAEAYLGRALVTQTITLTLDRFESVIELPRAPVQSVTSVTYLDTAGDSQSFTDFYADVANTSSPRLTHAYGFDWPATLAQIGAVQVVYVAGYGDGADVPKSIKQAILLLVGSMYENRENEVLGVSVTELPLTAKHLLHPYRLTQV